MSRFALPDVAFEASSLCDALSQPVSKAEEDGNLTNSAAYASVWLAIVFLHAITDACPPVCLFTAITSVEAVTPPKSNAINFTVASRAGKSTALLYMDAIARLPTP